MASSNRPEEHDSQDDQPTIREPEAAADAVSDAETGPRATAGSAAAPAPTVSADHAEETTRIPAHGEPEATVDQAASQGDTATEEAVTEVHEAQTETHEAQTQAHEAETRVDQPETTIDRTPDAAVTRVDRVGDEALEARREAAERLGVARSRNRVSTDIGLLILRVMNIVMFLHGLAKATGYGTFRQTVAANSVGALAPDLFAILVMVGQLVLPIAIALGFLTRLAGLLQAIMMAVIWVLFPLAGGLLDARTGGINGESAYLFVAVGLTLFFTGPGRISLDQVVFGRRGERRAAQRAVKKVS